MSKPAGATFSADYLFDSAPEPGQLGSVCADIEWARLPLPFALNHVNCWLLGEPGEQVLVDTGVANKGTLDLWQKSLGSANGVDELRLPKQLLVTHFHPDHMGLAGWFSSQGVAVLGSEIEVSVSLRVWAIDDASYGELYGTWYAGHGLPRKVVEAVRNSGNRYRGIVHEPPSESQWRYLKNGQKIELGNFEYEVITGRGHAPDMLMLYRDADHVLIAADQVLPAITPNVSVMPQLTDTNPLESFLQTLTALRELPEDTLVLPSHGLPFKGLRERLDFLAEHHEHRLADIMSACDRPICAYELFDVLFRRELDAQQTAFALGESLAHLRYLEHQGLLKSEVQDGVCRFIRS
ncbi:MAG: MBL fold metallo-hydrolase [Granulosicoccus sp.]